MRRAVLCDPHPLWLDAVERLLEGIAVGVVGTATSVGKAVDAVRQHDPDLLVTELLPLRDGLGWLQEVREFAPHLKIIVLSTNGEMENIEAALSAGVTAYVVKTAQPEDLASAVRQAFDHSVYLARWTHRGPASNGAGPAPAEDPQVAGPEETSNELLRSLTRRELEILRLVAEGASNAELARKLWVSEQTVKFHLSNVYRKLHVTNRTAAGRWAQLHGVLGSGAGKDASRSAA